MVSSNSAGRLNGITHVQKETIMISGLSLFTNHKLSSPLVVVCVRMNSYEEECILKDLYIKLKELMSIYHQLLCG